MPQARRLPAAAWVITASFCAAYALYALFRHWSFGSSGFDLGIFDQAIWHLSRFERPESTVGGYRTIFADHFHPILLTLAPIYAVFPRAETLLVAQSVLLSASIIPVFLYAQLRAGHAAAMAFSVAYGLFWGLQKAAAFDFHEVAFAPLFLSLSILAVETGRLRMFWASAVALCLVREDLIPVIGMLGLRLATLGYVRSAAAAVALSVGGFIAVIGFIIPALREGESYSYLSAYGGITLLNAPRQLVTPPQKLMTVAMWLGPFLFLPLRSPLILTAIPMALTRLLSNHPNHWGTAYHYGAPLAPVLAMAAADGFARLGGFRRNRLLRMGVLSIMVLLCAVLPGRLPIWRTLSVKHYARVAQVRTGYAALAVIPPEASVAAQDALVPHLTRRQAIYTLRPETPRTDYVIAAASLRPWPMQSFAEIRQILDARLRDGYRVVFAQDGWTVLRR